MTGLGRVPALPRGARRVVVRRTPDIGSLAGTAVGRATTSLSIAMPMIRAQRPMNQCIAIGTGTRERILCCNR